MKLRVIVSLVLIPLLLVVLFIAPPVVLSIVLGVVSAICAYELLAGTGLVKHIRLIAYSMIAAFLVQIWCYAGMPSLWGTLGLFLFVVALFAEVLFSHGKLRLDRLAVCAVGGLLIPLMLSALVRLMGDGTNRMMVGVPFVIAFLSDSGAYFVGSAWGKHKLAPVISPNKSVEGLMGGVLSGILGMLIYCLILLCFGAKINFLFAITYGIMGAFAGTFGDLCFSAIKRQTGIKDYGNLIPGHGGMLDRMDSLIIVVPLTELLAALMPVVE